MTRSKKLSDSQVLKLALEVIIEQGPESFTLEQISKKTRLAPATLIQRFKTKQNLLMEVLKQDHVDFAESIKKDLEKWKALGVQGVVQFLSQMLQGLNSENLGEHVALLAKDFSEPKLNKLARERMDLVRQTIHAILESAVSQGELRKTVNLEEWVLHLEAFWHGSAIQWGFLKRGSIKTWVIERLNVLLENLIKNPNHL